MPNGRIELAWGDGDHAFNVAKIGQALELEEKCGSPGQPCGLMEILTRLREQRWRINDIRETIRIGLIGGGKKPLDALSLVKRYVDDRPLAENVQLAQVILIAAIVGVPGDEVGKDEAEQAAKEGEQPLSAPPSTAPEPSSDGLPELSMNAPSGNSPPPLMPTTGTRAETTVPRP